MKELMVQKSNRTRNKRRVALLALCLVGATGFVAVGGDAVVMNYISPTAPVENEDSENPIPGYESMASWLIRHVHAHMREFHSMGHSEKSE